MMKARVLIMLLLLLLCTAIFASEDPSDAAEHARKTQELNQLAERFKAETGFTGSINYGYERMRLGSFEGNFSDIPFTTEADTIAFRQACERIVDKILPLSPANRMQLSMSRISKSVSGYTTDYYQQVGGYRVEGAGFIMITYEEGRKRFSIGDNTVELPLKVASSVISFEEAVRITKYYYIQNLGYPEDIEIRPATKSIAFVKFDNQYVLCHVLGIPDPNPHRFIDYTIVIDAITGQVRDLWDLMSHLYFLTRNQECIFLS